MSPRRRSQTFTEKEWRTILFLREGGWGEGDAETVYERLSYSWNDLVEKVEISKSTDKKSDSFEVKIYKTDEIPQTESTIGLTRCDNFSALKCFCLQLTKDIFPHGLQSVLLTLKVSAEVAIITQGNFYSRKRKLNTLLFTPGSALRARVTQKRFFKLGSTECLEQNKDLERVRFIHKQLEKHGCTTPWMLHFTRSENLSWPVCDSTTSKGASAVYMKHRHPPDPSQDEQPCADMTLTTTLLSSINDNSNTVTISFDEMIEVSKEVVAFTFLQMVAEVGGFIALILGVSFIDLFRILDHVQTKLVERLIGKNIFNSMFQ